MSRRSLRAAAVVRDFLIELPEHLAFTLLEILTIGALMRAVNYGIKARVLGKSDCCWSQESTGTNMW